jgi:hypothetical protein
MIRKVIAVLSTKCGDAADDLRHSTVKGSGPGCQDVDQKRLSTVQAYGSCLSWRRVAQSSAGTRFGRGTGFRRLMRGAYGGDFRNCKTVPSAVILPSISSAATPRTSIAVSENRVAATSTLTDAARHRFDALSIRPLRPCAVDPRTAVTESRGHLVAAGRRYGGRRLAGRCLSAAPARRQSGAESRNHYVELMKRS